MIPTEPIGSIPRLREVQEGGVHHANTAGYFLLIFPACYREVLVTPQCLPLNQVDQAFLLQSSIANFIDRTCFMETGKTKVIMGAIIFVFIIYSVLLYLYNIIYL